MYHILLYLADFLLSLRKFFKELPPLGEVVLTWEPVSTEVTEISITTIRENNILDGPVELLGRWRDCKLKIF